VCGQSPTERRFFGHRSSYFNIRQRRKLVNSEKQEAAYARLLGIASRDLREGRYLHALVIFGSLAKVEFTRQRDARHGEAVAQARMGQFKEAFTESEKKLKKFVSDYPDPTVSKADALKSLAEVSIGLQHFDGIGQILEEAAQIYDTQGLTKANGSIVHLQGLVALWNEDFENAIEKFTWAATLSEIKIPEVVPSGFGIEAQPEPTTSDQFGFANLAGMRL
jgi:tetratricopeptide (TPR) repeat protein